MTSLVIMKFEFLGIFDVFKCEITQKSKFKASKIVKMTVFDGLKFAKIDFTQNQSGRKIAKFPHCGVEITRFYF